MVTCRSRGRGGCLCRRATSRMRKKNRNPALSKGVQWTSWEGQRKPSWWGPSFLQQTWIEQVTLDRFPWQQPVEKRQADESLWIWNHFGFCGRGGQRGGEEEEGEGEKRGREEKRGYSRSRANLNGGELDCFFFLCSCQNTSRYGPVGRHRWAGHGSVGPRRRREIWTTAIFSKQNKATEQPNHEPSSKYLIELRINYTREPRNCLRVRLYTPATTCRKTVHKRPGCIVCDEKWLDVLCLITRTRGNGSVNY